MKLGKGLKKQEITSLITGVLAMVRKIKEKNDWDPWIKLQQSEDFWAYDFIENATGFDLFIEAYPDYKRKAATLAMTIAKWHPRNTKRGYSYCAACEVCPRCSHLCLAYKVCGLSGSLYSQFCQADSDGVRDAIADQIYSILRADYDKELAKVEKREKSLANGR